MTACGGHEKMSIHRIVSAAVALLALFAAPHAFGQPAGGAAPQRVEIMVGYGAGTGVDSIARYYADRLQKKTGCCLPDTASTGLPCCAPSPSRP